MWIIDAEDGKAEKTVKDRDRESEKRVQQEGKSEGERGWSKRKRESR